MAKIKDLAQACKSKNAGPYECTLDIVFRDSETFEKVRSTGILGPELIARLYNVDQAEVIFTEFPPAYAFKATIPRDVVSGDPGDTDVYGAQQHSPLLDVDIPI